jgi:hypothetical protein
MEIALYQVIAMFGACNDEYFDCALPLPKFKLMHSYRKLGCFSCNYDQNGYMYNQTISISDNYNYTEDQFRDILVHEMIHYYLAYYGEDIDCTHGKKFKEMSQDFNIRYGMDIHPTVRIYDYQVKKGKSKLLYALSKLF